MAFDRDWLNSKDLCKENAVRVSGFGYAASGGLSSYELYALLELAGPIKKYWFCIEDPGEILSGTNKVSLALYHDKLATVEDPVSASCINNTKVCYCRVHRPQKRENCYRGLRQA